jgi:hypothetical protein
LKSQRRGPRSSRASTPPRCWTGSPAARARFAHASHPKSSCWSDLLAHATGFLERAGSSGLAIDVTDAWSVCTVAGADAAEVWARLSENRLPDERPAFVQGAVASVPAKTIAGDGEIHVLTPSNLGHHLPHQIFGQCRDLAPQAGTPRPFAVRCTATDTPVAASPVPARARVAS